MALGLLQSATFVPVAFLLQRLFNVAIPHHDRSQIVLIGLAIGALGLFGGALGAAAQRVGSSMARGVVTDLRRDLVRRLYAQSAAWHNHQDPGVLALTVVQHTERLVELLAQLTARALPAVALAVSLTLATLLLSPLLTLCVVAAIPAYVVVGRWLGGRARRLSRGWLAAHHAFGGAMRVGLRTLPLARAHGAEPWELERRGAEIEALRDASRRLDQTRASYEGAYTAITGIGGVAPLVLGSLAVSDGTMSLGTLLAFYSLGLLALRATGTAVAGLSNAATSSEALGAIEAILADEPPPPREGLRLEPLRGGIVFDRVTFAYDDVVVLNDLSFAVSPGEHVALMGPSGAGKTTVVSLVLGLYEPLRGAVLIDDHPLEELDIATLRSQIGVVMQDNVVFEGTVRDNIAHGQFGDIEGAAALAGLDLDQLPGGLNYDVGDEGCLLSGGQRQRVGLARALLRRPRLLILDEPTLHLDARSIDRLLDTLDGLDCTILTVTHDTRVAARADRVVLVRDGAVEERLAAPTLP